MGQRPGRIEPRAVERRPKPFARLTVPRQIAREQIARRGHADPSGQPLASEPAHPEAKANGERDNPDQAINGRLFQIGTIYRQVVKRHTFPDGGDRDQRDLRPLKQRRQQQAGVHDLQKQQDNYSERQAAKEDNQWRGARNRQNGEYRQDQKSAGAKAGRPFERRRRPRK